VTVVVTVVVTLVTVVMEMTVVALEFLMVDLKFTAMVDLKLQAGGRATSAERQWPTTYGPFGSITTQPTQMRWRIWKGASQLTGWSGITNGMAATD